MTEKVTETEVGTDFRVEFFRKTLSVKVSFTDKFTEKEQKILEIIFENPAVSSVEIGKKLGVSRTTVAAYIKRLKERGAIERIGSDRKGYWKILEK